MDNTTIQIRKLPALCVATAALFAYASAQAAPIAAVEFPANFAGPATCLGAGNSAASLSANAVGCAAANGFVMTPFGDDPNMPGMNVSSVASPLGGTVHFREQGGANPLQMIVGDPGGSSDDPDHWWQHSGHSSVYMTGVHWVELHFDMAGLNPVRGEFTSRSGSLGQSACPSRGQPASKPSRLTASSFDYRTLVSSCARSPKSPIR